MTARNDTNPFTTIRLAAADTIHLATPRRQRAALALSVATLAACLLVLAGYAIRPSYAPLAARIPPPVIILATAQPTPPMPTPDNRPRVVELVDGSVVAFDGHTWQLASDAAPTVAPEPPAVTLASYQPPAAADAPPLVEQAAPEASAPVTNVSDHPFVAATTCDWHPPMAVGTCE
jgi:hypothetical protein